MTGPLPERVLESLDEICRTRWGRSSRTAGVCNLTRRAASVTRVWIEGGGPATIIVKHTADHFPLDDTAESNPEFLEEQVAHRFLAGLSLERGLKPALLAWDPRGITVLEDLGERNFDRTRTYAELIPRLSAALVRLHAGTRAHADEYWRLRRDAGLGDAFTDRRRHGTAADARRFARGRTFVVHRAGAGRLRHDSRALARELDLVAGQVAEPGIYRALVHGDLGNVRQTFEVGADLYLLDFEGVRFGHALLDLCTPMIGKFEVSLDDGSYGWSCARFPLELAEDYRHRLDAAYGMRASTDAWNQALGASLVHTALVLVGRLVDLTPAMCARLVGTVPQNVNGVLYRLGELLDGLACFPVLRRILAELVEPYAAGTGRPPHRMQA